MCARKVAMNNARKYARNVARNKERKYAKSRKELGKKVCKKSS